MWEFGEDESHRHSLTSPTDGSTLPKISNLLPNVVSGVVGGLLAVTGSGTATPPSKPVSFMDIQKEMEEARRKAREEARRLEEEEEELAQKEAMEREKLAVQLTLQKQRQSTIPAFSRTQSPTPFQDEIRDEVVYGDDKDGDDEDMEWRMQEAQRVMAQLEQLEKTAAALESRNDAQHEDADAALDVPTPVIASEDVALEEDVIGSVGDGEDPTAQPEACDDAVDSAIVDGASLNDAGDHSAATVEHPATTTIETVVDNAAVETLDSSPIPTKEVEADKQDDENPVEPENSLASPIQEDDVALTEESLAGDDTEAGEVEGS
ncbi:hypothetical protein HDV05_002164 [Chytridiales sp. JEL 0842]|nr:hypothetical protein HDV05_002164 [Chytridiales sp. JEL 0842]